MNDPKTSPGRLALDPLEGGRIRSKAESVGAGLAEAFTVLVSQLRGAPLGPKLLAERYDISIGTASRFIRAIAETEPLEVLQDIPGPVPLRRFLSAAAKTGTAADAIALAESAVEDFAVLIRQFGGNRRGLSAVLANWQPKGRKQFVLLRRQAAYQALAELKGVSSSLCYSSFVFFPSAEEAFLDTLTIRGEIAISRSRPDSTFYLGNRRLPAKDEVEPDPRKSYTLDGHSAVDGLHTVRLDGFTNGKPAPIITTQVGQELIHTLGPTELEPEATVDLVLAEVTRPGLRRRGPGFCTDPLSVYTIGGTPTRKLNLDLLIHEDCVPDGRAELLVYSTVPHGPAIVGDLARAHDLEQIPETLELRHADVRSLHIPVFPRYLDVLEHSFGKLGLNASKFSSWRLQVDFPTPGTQYCIQLGRKRTQISQ